MKITDEATCLKGEILVVQPTDGFTTPKTVTVDFAPGHSQEFFLSWPGLTYGPLDASYDVTTSSQQVEVTCVAAPPDMQAESILSMSAAPFFLLGGVLLAIKYFINPKRKAER